ncbi:hypothetical protein TSTA_091060 [Talaromyces stipitatus ATCC 10500]|uniref:Uncharacterized protein n=1 Tax=Talaromyces stipitatus (strain ATCC 10500 / CBS 375.48 / QM 6759 / NRRL 1006) TaxID=441959 RepID=B8M1H0_TALSN|nr:uncharacterized protein TSTA_091060 [Talaromyces stipitatus ATCC 10500]EED21866.1 hypothetical protein TSTA_091060 [Talaromyces stipitatus ATCC 10500]
MTLDAVFDIIWDILLSFYVIRGALHYSTLTFICSLPLAGSSLVLTYPTLDFTQRQTQATILFFFTVIVFVCAQYTMRLYKVPYQTSYRLSIGLVGAVFLLGGELAAWTVLHKRWSIWREWYEQSNAIVLGGLGVMAAIFALMPCLLMLAGGAAESLLMDEPPDVAEEQTKKD